MTGVIWLILTFCVIGIFIVSMAYRIISLSRQPVHLRWELAPAPLDKGKIKYGGSYLEDFEWWKKPRQKSHIAPVVYMAREIFTLKSVRENNPSLWPFSISLHFGIYLIILALVFYFISALLTINGASQSLSDTFYSITAVIVAAGCIMGILGSAGLILKRSIDAGLREYSSFSTYFRLALLLAVFASGGIGMIMADNYAREMSFFVQGIITLDKEIAVTTASSVHIIISFLFALYLPFTNMVHFITKHFTYYGVRWNDEPLNSRMAVKLNELAAQKTDWSAAHTGAHDKKNWSALTEDTGDQEKH